MKIEYFLNACSKRCKFSDVVASIVCNLLMVVTSSVLFVNVVSLPRITRYQSGLFLLIPLIIPIFMLLYLSVLRIDYGH